MINSFEMTTTTDLAEMEAHIAQERLKLGAALKTSRVSCGVPQTVLARKLGVSQPTLSAWEMMHRPVPLADYNYAVQILAKMEAEKAHARRVVEDHA